MRIRTQTALYGALLALLMSAPASADGPFNDANLFVTGKLGATKVRDADFTSGISTAGVPLNGEIESNPGYVIGAEAGALYSSGLYGSVEVLYYDAGTDQFTVNTPTGTFGTGPLNGDVDGLMAFANLGYEYYTEGPLKPFVVGGIGLARVSIDNATGPTVVAGAVDDSDIVLAGKLGTGVALELQEGIDLIGAYNFIITQDLDLNFSAPTQTTNFSVDYSQHLFNVGLRVGF